jgi:hypothetical protein
MPAYATPFLNKEDRLSAKSFIIFPLPDIRSDLKSESFCIFIKSNRRANPLKSPLVLVFVDL